MGAMRCSTGKDAKEEEEEEEILSAVAESDVTGVITAGLPCPCREASDDEDEDDEESERKNDALLEMSFRGSGPRTRTVAVTAAAILASSGPSIRDVLDWSTGPSSSSFPLCRVCVWGGESFSDDWRRSKS